MNLIQKKTKKIVGGLGKVVKTTEYVKHGTEQMIQESFIVYFLGVPIRSDFKLRRPGLADAVKHAWGTP